MNSCTRKKAGFTLIEVLFVIVIIAILAGIAVPKFGNKLQKSQISAAKTAISSLDTALDLYRLDNGKFPSSLQDLVKQPGNAKNWDGPYVKKASMLEDPWGNAFIYQNPGAHNTKSYDLSSSGPEGGEAITNWE